MQIGILTNGKIVEENTMIHLMTKYKASHVDDLLITIVLAEDSYRDSWRDNASFIIIIVISISKL